MTRTPYAHPLDQYRTVDAYGAAAADRLQLISRMLQGALDRITAARGHMVRGEIAAKGEALGRAIRLVDGLHGCLDMERGGGIAANLAALYDYMTRRLIEGNLHNDPRALDEVTGLLEDIRDGWQEMSRQQAATGTASHAGAVPGLA